LITLLLEKKVHWTGSWTLQTQSSVLVLEIKWQSFSSQPLILLWYDNYENC